MMRWKDSDRGMASLGPGSTCLWNPYRDPCHHPQSFCLCRTKSISNKEGRDRASRTKSWSAGRSKCPSASSVWAFSKLGWSWWDNRSRRMCSFSLWLVTQFHLGPTNRTHVDLYLSNVVPLQLATGKIGPSCVAKVWIPGEHALKPHKQYDFLQQATWFGHYLRKLGKAFHLELEVVRTRPAGTVIQFWNRCYKIRANAAVINGLDRLFESTSLGCLWKRLLSSRGYPS